MKRTILIIALFPCLAFGQQQIDFSKMIKPNWGPFTIGANNTNGTAAPTILDMDTLFGSCSGANKALTWNTSTHVFGCNTITPGTGTVTSLAFSAPLTGGTITTSGTVGITKADTSTDGYLSSIDWNTFNNKGSGSVTSIATTAPIGGGTITTTGTITCTTCAIGPGSSTANHLAKFSGTDGLTLADGGAIPTGTVTSIATTSPITGGTITATGTIACPTCLTGPNISTVGGIVGSYIGAIGNSSSYGWFQFQTLAGLSGFSTDVWLYNLTANTTSTNGVGAYNLYGYVYYYATTATNEVPQFSIPGSAAAASYQSANPIAKFIPGGARTGIAVSGLSPANSVASKTNYVTANVVGSHIQPLGNQLNNDTVAGSTTRYSAPSSTTVLQSTEALSYVVMPTAGQLSSLCIFNSGAQPAGGTLAVTLRQNAADTSLTTAIPASGGVGTYCDYSDTVTVAAGDLIAWKIVNGSGSTSATLGAIVMNFVPSTNATAVVIFSSAGQTIGSGAAVYFGPLVATTATGTESNSTAPMPRAGTAKNLYCYVNTAPGTSSDVVTLRQNSASPASGLTVTITTSTTGVISDTTHTVSLANKDSIALQHNQASGTNPVVSSCSMEID